MSVQKVNNQIWDILTRATQVARIMNIEEIAFDDHAKGKMLRGFDATHGAPVILNHIFEDDELELPFKSLAINSCSSFIDKLKLAQTRDEEYITNITIDDNSQKVTEIHFRGKKFKLDFNTGNSDTVRAPKSIKDTTAHSFNMLPKDIATLNQSIKAMKGEDVTLISDGTNISYEVKVGAKDVFSLDICDNFDSVAEKNNRSFVHSYPFKTLYPVLSSCEDCLFHITTRGLLKCKIEGITVYVMPRML
jgi:hypothetical protein